MNLKPLSGRTGDTDPHVVVSAADNPYSGAPSEENDGFPFEGDSLHIQALFEGGSGFESTSFAVWAFSHISKEWAPVHGSFGGPQTYNLSESDGGGYIVNRDLPGAERVYLRVASPPADGVLKIWLGRAHGV